MGANEGGCGRKRNTHIVGQDRGYTVGRRQRESKPLANAALCSA